MSDRHWTDEEMLLRLFDVGPQDGHLESCPVCARRWETVHAKYQSRPEGLYEVPEEQLRAQRLAIRERIGHRKRKSRLIFVPTLAASLIILAFVVVIFRQAPRELPGPEDFSQDLVLEEIFSTALSTEPEGII